MTKRDKLLMFERFKSYSLEQRKEYLDKLEINMLAGDMIAESDIKTLRAYIDDEAYINYNIMKLKEELLEADEQTIDNAPVPVEGENSNNEQISDTEETYEPESDGNTETNIDEPEIPEDENDTDDAIQNSDGEILQLIIQIQDKLKTYTPTPVEVAAIKALKDLVK